jgi:hypothetical protein
MRFVLFLSLVAMGFSSCINFPKDELLGSWQGESLSTPMAAIPFPAETIFTFYGDGGYKITMPGLEFTGSYSILGKTLTLNRDGVAWNIPIIGITNDEILELNLRQTGEEAIYRLKRLNHGPVRM